MPTTHRHQRSSRRRRSLRHGGLVQLLVAILAMATSLSVSSAQPLPCNPCAGVFVDDPASVLDQLDDLPALTEGTFLAVAWETPLTPSTDASIAVRLAERGTIPVLRMVFATPSPMVENLESLEAELEEASRLASSAGDRALFQIVWRPPNRQGGDLPTVDYAFLIKRAAVAVTGAQLNARVISQPLSPQPEVLRRLFDEDLAAYLDGVALEPGSGDLEQSSIDLLMELDPGTPIVAEGEPYPEPPWRSIPIAARHAVEGYSLSLFDASSLPHPDLRPLVLLAREFRGDVAYDPYSSPTTNDDVSAWSFVRGEDLGLRVVVEAPSKEGEPELTFSDRQLRNPQRIDLTSGEPLAMYGGLGGSDGYVLRWQSSEPVALLRLERPGAGEIEGMEGLEEEVTVVSDRLLPVEEILRRLQAVEDAQSRRIRSYQAVNTTHLRFQFGAEGLEVTFEGEIFYRQDIGYDWAWQKFNLNGLRWKGREFPKIPLIQPERAANLPLEILFRPDYRYSLRGTDVVEGRDCWVVEFRPVSLEEGESLFRGTVWIDRQLFVRVRSRAVQLGLDGEVISNEETITYTPVDSEGLPGAWIEGNSWLPLRIVSNQIWSVFNTSLVVEKETHLRDVEINSPEFEGRRQELLASNYTMVRDTDQGMRYLVPDKKSGERVVKEKLSSNRFFLAGGVFYDPSLDYPLPLVGFDFFSLDFLDKGSQVNVFFGGALLTASYADPEFLGSRFDAGVDLFAIGVRGSDTLYRGDQEVPEEEVEQLPLSLALNLGHPIGQFVKVTFTYRLGYTDYSRTDNTAEAFVLPADHYTHTLRLGGAYSRFGYRLRLGGSYNKRSDWQPWGLPDSGDFDPNQAEFLRWGASLSKTFYFERFRRAGIDLQYVDGRNLDRFSKYQLGFFSDVRVRGYESNRIRAERALASTFSYGVDFGELFRLQGLADAAWITDDAGGLDREFASGVGIAGTVIGPWKTILRLDLGKAVAGPDDGYSAFLAFLRLW